MSKILIGIVIGIVIATVGITGIFRVLDKSIQVIHLPSMMLQVQSPIS